MAKKKDLKKLLEYDALNEAEKMTGGSIDDPKSIAGSLGTQNFFENNAIKREALKALDDTTFHCSMENHLRIAKAIGFEQILEIPFTGKPYGGKPYQERFVVLWRKGLLLTCDTYQGERNIANLAFNWIPKNRDDMWEVRASGGIVTHEGRDIRVGDLDVREALRFHVEQLEELGTILEKWVERPYLHLLHHEDWEKYDFKKGNIDATMDATDALAEERIKMLPTYVQDAIGPKKD